MPNILEYTNYRKYLGDWFSEEKKKTPHFSHRYLAQKLELTTPNFILLVIQGKRNLSRTTVFKLCRFMKLTNIETEYFENLVNYAQAKRHDEKDRYFNSIIAMRHDLKVAKIEDWQYEYYNKWYNLVVRELVVQPDFNGDFRALAKKIAPQITETEARRSVELLLKLNLIKLESGKYVQTDEVISTESEASSLAVAMFHRTMSQLAGESIERFLQKERSITSCTVRLNEDDFLSIKREAFDFMRKAAEIAEAKNNDGPARVYQLNMQLFPLSKSET
jgi:uncharacterized protein (TIGR02147 family)